MKQPYTAERRLERIVRRTKRGPGGCLLFTGPLDKAGYALGGRERLAHRTVWFASGRAIPPGMEIDHICRVRSCVNIDHLRAVTHAENLRNRVGGNGGTPDRCYLGHPKTLTKGGAPVCKTCRMDALRRWRSAHPEEARAVYRASKAADRRRAGIRPRGEGAKGPSGGGRE